jgi:FK506-binding protein 1
VSTIEGEEDAEEVRRRAARRGARGAKAVAAFLKAYKLDMLLDLLLREGFDDMNALIAIQDSDIEELGVKRRLRRPLLVAVLEYRNKHGIVDPLDERASGSEDGSDKEHEEGKQGWGGEEQEPEPDAAEREGKVREFKSAAVKDDESDEEGEDPESDHDSVKGDDDIPGVEIVSVFKGDGVHFPRKGQFALVHYVASLENGTIIESSRKRGRPLDFLVGARHVVPGLDKAIRRLSRGERANVTLAPELAYGPKGRPPVVPPNARIRLEVELIDNYFAPVGELIGDDELEHEEHEGAPGRRAIAAVRGGGDNDDDDDDA